MHKAASSLLPGSGKRTEVHGWLHRNRINILLLLLACTAALTAGLRLMTPNLAEALADSLPGSWVRTSSEKVLAHLETGTLLASQRPLAEQDALRDRFAALNAAPEGAPPYRLLFRRNLASDRMLLTLPGGEIIVTDQFMQTVPDPAEQLALLCHELGHLYYRHALRSAIEHNLFWLASAAFVGSSESSVRALVNGLEHADYGREHVLEADRYALSMLRTNGLPARLLQDAIEHGQGPAGPAQIQRDPLTHRQYFNERIRALQNLL
ncbi:M48 family metallopeptidase [Uliginosibacterium sp. 31-16]|uniref:M48 family metallopeptidase n=1 Tax=Uliginosibacterium sp. 31-16 TaxID=3068315 RepID=UPI00273F89B8|nr:M48 family metallopeptidase [Uliginosibacterium sp. 31-16]MDP5238523.1 M48 family metallopeptidase [Uliginosibacterium sp. 31-16]